MLNYFNELKLIACFKYLKKFNNSNQSNNNKFKSFKTLKKSIFLILW